MLDAGLMVLVLGNGYWTWDSGYWVLGNERRILDTGYWALGYWILDTGYWILDARYWTLNAELRQEELSQINAATLADRGAEICECH